MVRMSLRGSQVAVWAVLVTLGYLLVHAAQVLPERVALHFDLAGTADGWGTRGLLLGIFACMTALVAGLGLALPVVVGVLPTSMVNVPHREYWLAPERRQQTLATLRDDLSWFAALTGVLMILLFQRTIAYNLDPESKAMASALWIVLAYLLATLLWVARLLLRYRLPGDPGQPADTPGDPR